MDPPQIRYATTSDGVRIAYYAIGDGEPVLVTPPLGPSHLLLERRFEPLEAWYRHFSAHRTLIRWDARGFGMSDRKVEDISDETYDRDIDAVLAALGLVWVDVVASGPGALFALSYAARHPDAVRKLLLVNTLLRWMEHFPGRPGRAILALAEQDWELFTQNAARARLGWSRTGGQDFAELIRESQLQEDFLRLLPWWEAWDASPYLPSIRAETLVIYDGAVPFWGRRYPTAAREIASSVPKASVLEVRYGNEAWFESQQIARPIDEFLGIASEVEVERDKTPSSSGTTVILFADIVDSTALSEQLGDTAFRERSRVLEERVRKHVTAHAGTPVEGRTLGDGVLATFASASDAIAAARDCATAGEDVGLALHLGLHAGDVIREQGNVYGQAVSIAARVSDLSAPNEVLVSGTVRDLARASSGVSFEDRGERELKGVSERVRLWRVMEQGTGNREQS